MSLIRKDRRIAEGWVLYLNDSLARMLEKSREGYLGMRGGEVMECMFARLPQGCGNTVHCSAVLADPFSY